MIATIPEKSRMSPEGGDVRAEILRGKVTAGGATGVVDLGQEQTVLWALAHARKERADLIFGNLCIYTDSQCVAGLLGRRAALVENDYIAKRSGRTLANAALYREFYAAYDQMGFRMIKVSGHSPFRSHNTVQRIFSYVDRGVRNKLHDLD